MSQTEVQLIKSSSVVDGDIVGMSSSKLSGTLPAISAANLTNIPAANLTGALPAISGAALTGTGITMMDQWRLYDNVSVGANTTVGIYSNWERNDNNFSQIGSGMTESSGVFTFPSTGIYRVDCRWSVFCSSTSNRYVSIRTELSTDGGSSYAIAAVAYTNLPNLGETLDHATSDLVVDVTNASNFKIRTVSSSSQPFTFAGNQWAGINANAQTNSMTFMKLGET